MVLLRKGRFSLAPEDGMRDIHDGGCVHQWRNASLVSMRRLAQAVGIEAGMGAARNWMCCPSFSSFQFHCLVLPESAPESRHEGPGQRPSLCPAGFG